MPQLMGIFTAFGLSGAAGLNAYIPLLLTGVLARFNVIHLSSPYDILENWWVIGILSVLLVIEMVVDKIPGADHVNDIIQTFVRPTAGALLFASAAGIITDINPYIALGLGLLMSGGVHITKAAARPVVNTATLGLGAPVVSFIEDALALVMAVLAIVLPIMIAFFLALLVVLAVWVFRRRRQRRQLVAVAAGA